MTLPLVHLENLSLILPESGKALLQDLSLTIYQGQFVVLLGPNGCGKSSLIRLLSGTRQATSGNILFLGKSTQSRQLRRRAHMISTLTQDLAQSTFGNLSVIDNIRLAELKISPWPWAKNALRTPATLEKLLFTMLPTLQGKSHTRVSDLSGGERQMLGLFLCLLHPPKLLLLDEHTSALDPLASAKVMEQTAHQIASQQLTALMTTHRLDQALNYGNRLLVMNQGKIILDFDESQKKLLREEDLLRLSYTSESQLQ